MTMTFDYEDAPPHSDDDAPPDDWWPTSRRDDGHELNIPSGFYSARPELEIISQAAHARLVARDAVLLAVLARVAAFSPHTIELPGIIGAPVGLTFLGGIVGPPGAGKSAGAAVASHLIAAPLHVPDLLPIGSGEGMVEVLFEMVEEEDERGKSTKVKRQTKYAACFHIDEGAVLADLGGRSGATLMTTVRTAFTHGVLGNTNASVERRRIVRGTDYVYGITLGIQPALAGPLLDDASGGTPQRIVWATATDPFVDIHATWPGPVDWQPFVPRDLEQIVEHRNYQLRHVLYVDPVIVTEVRNHRIGVVSGSTQLAAMDEHRTLAKLKVAALLAMLNGRVDVNSEDWHLAEIVLTTSDAVRADMQAVIASDAERREIAASFRQIHHEVRSEDARRQRALTSSLRTIGKVVRRHDGTDHPTGLGCNRSCLTRAMNGDYRSLISLDEVIDEAVRADLIRIETNPISNSVRYRPPRSKP